MGTCVGCGTALAPNWKFCIHCGLAIEHPDVPGAPGVSGHPEVPGAIRPDSAGTAARPAAANRLLVVGGVGIFLVGIALLVISIAFFAGGLR